MNGLTNCILQNNCKIFCNSNAYDFEKHDNFYITKVNNHIIKSKYLIVASHYPFKKIKRFLLFKNVSIYFICPSNRYTF